MSLRFPVPAWVSRPVPRGRQPSAFRAATRPGKRRRTLFGRVFRTHMMGTVIRLVTRGGWDRPQVLSQSVHSPAHKPDGSIHRFSATVSTGPHPANVPGCVRSRPELIPTTVGGPSRVRQHPRLTSRVWRWFELSYDGGITWCGGTAVLDGNSMVRAEVLRGFVAARARRICESGRHLVDHGQHHGCERGRPWARCR